MRTEREAKALYHVPEDPLELHNLVASVDCRETIHGLDRILERHMSRTGDDWGIKAVFPPPDFQSHADGSAYADGLFERAFVEP